VTTNQQQAPNTDCTDYFSKKKKLHEQTAQKCYRMTGKKVSSLKKSDLRFPDLFSYKIILFYKYIYK